MAYLVGLLYALARCRRWINLYNFCPLFIITNYWHRTIYFGAISQLKLIYYAQKKIKSYSYVSMRHEFCLHGFVCAHNSVHSIFLTHITFMASRSVGRHHKLMPMKWNEFANERKPKELIYIDGGFLFDMRSLYFTIKLSTHQKDTQPARCLVFAQTSNVASVVLCTVHPEKENQKTYINLHIIILCLKWLRGSLSLALLRFACNFLQKQKTCVWISIFWSSLSFASSVPVLVVVVFGLFLFFLFL